MYAWIWRHLPFGLPGRIIGSLLMAASCAALLWYVAFPAIDPHLPFNNDGQVSSSYGPTGNGSHAPGPAPSPTR